MHVRQCHKHRRALAFERFLHKAVRGHEEHAIAHVGEADVAVRVGHRAGRRLGAVELDISCKRIRHVAECLRVGVEHVPIHRILLGVGEVVDWLVATFIRPLGHVVDVEDHALERRLVVRVRDVDGALTTARDNARREVGAVLLRIGVFCVDARHSYGKARKHRPRAQYRRRDPLSDCKPSHVVPPWFGEVFFFSVVIISVSHAVGFSAPHVWPACRSLQRARACGCGAR